MRILYVTTVSSTMNAFFKAHIRMLTDEGHHVDLACNDEERPIDPFYTELGCVYHHVDFTRSPLSPSNLKAYRQIKRVVGEGNYDVVHCHTPIAAACTRLACRRFRKKRGLKVYYTAHGFHFYKGAPLKNWMIFYTVEKLCAHYTDKLITINREDYELATRKMKAKEIFYVPGVGVDLSRFQDVSTDSASKRRELGIPEDATVLLSVGELNENKNQQVIIRAMARLGREDVHYALAGVGPWEERLVQLADSLGLGGRVHLLGYRRDVPELLRAADVFCFPSYREGLGLASIEAMACGLPLVTSNIHGINDYSEDGVTGYKCAPNDVEGFARALERLVEDPALRSRLGQGNVARADKYDTSRILPLMRSVYGL